MAKFQFKQTTNMDGYFSAKLKASLTDNDIGKPVKLSTDTTDTYELCADGDGIDGFLTGLESATADGLVFGTINNKGMIRVEASGEMNIGDLVESGAVAAADTAETNGLPLVSTHTPDTTTAITLAADLFQVNWRVVSGSTSDGVVATGDTTVIIERL